MTGYIQNKRLSRFIYHIGNLEASYIESKRVAQLWHGEYWCYPWYLYGVFDVLSEYTNARQRFYRILGLSNDELFMAYWLTKNTRINHAMESKNMAQKYSEY